MKCRYCGYEIPRGKLYCNHCGKEVFIVPDYNPLDDMLAEQVKVSVNGGKDTGELDISRRTGGRSPARRNTRTSTGRTMPERERQRRQMEKRKAIRKKKRRRLLIIFGILLLAAAGISVLLYLNSYNGVVRKGYKALETKRYEEAASCFQKAIYKEGRRAEAYTGLSKVYSAQGEPEKAEALFDEAVEKYSQSADIYRAYIEYIADEGDVMEIPVLLYHADDSVRTELAEYIIDEPEFDLDDEEVYDDVQQLTFSTEGKTIYYTTDGSDPSPESEKYTEPIQLDEGENVIKAIAVNKKGIPSMIAEKTYVIEFPIEDAPAVSPSTGQYDSAQKIEVKVPEGYEAYYTLDGEDPTTASKKYQGPVDMPEGETLFKAVLVNAKGRTSAVTTRNYQLYISSGEE